MRPQTGISQHVEHGERGLVEDQARDAAGDRLVGGQFAPLAERDEAVLRGGVADRREVLVADGHHALRVRHGQGAAALVHLDRDLARKLERGEELLKRLKHFQLAHAVVDEIELAPDRAHIGDVDIGIARERRVLRGDR